MRVLLDNCVPRRLANHISGHYVDWVVDRGWAMLDDGPLLAQAAAEFDVLVTVDKSIQHQQSLSRLRIAVVVLRAPSNKLAQLVPLVPRLIEVLGTVKLGEVVEIHAP